MRLQHRARQAAHAIAALSAFSASIWAIGFAPLPFISSVWRSEWASGDAVAWERTLKVRHRMADTLVATRELIGKSEAEIAELLGPPLPADKFQDRDVVYVLGPERGFLSLDYEWLVIDLDSTGRVAVAKVVRD